jgi:hypothetical protein
VGCGAGRQGDLIVTEATAGLAKHDATPVEEMGERVRLALDGDISPPSASQSTSIMASLDVD